MDTLQGKTAIITGTSSGIGEATALLFARHGAKVVLAARRLDKLEGVAAAVRAAGGQALAVAADVGVEADCVRLVEQAARTFGGVDILVNNAGMADKHRPITNTSTEWWEEVNRINQTSVYYMTREALKYMEPAGIGSIVNLSSVGGVFGSAGIAYSASKAAVIGMTKNVAIQFADRGIRCNCVCPGPTPTELNAPEKLKEFDPFAKVCRKHMNNELPNCTTEDQANAILFFASDAAKAITGQVLIVDHGATL